MGATLLLPSQECRAAGFSKLVIRKIELEGTPPLNGVQLALWPADPLLARMPRG